MLWTNQASLFLFPVHTGYITFYFWPYGRHNAASVAANLSFHGGWQGTVLSAFPLHWASGGRTHMFFLIKPFGIFPQHILFVWCGHVGFKQKWERNKDFNFYQATKNKKLQLDFPWCLHVYFSSLLCKFKLCHCFLKNGKMITQCL